MVVYNIREPALCFPEYTVVEQDSIRGVCPHAEEFFHLVKKLMNVLQLTLPAYCCIHRASCYPAEFCPCSGKRRLNLLYIAVSQQKQDILL